ncbi:MAG: STM4015 family protein [Candidatus Lokiarchaeota archaeon]|nr:STM4015 family protein [Candidatus Lokiarchaeota archaeon]
MTNDDHLKNFDGKPVIDFYEDFVEKKNDTINQNVVYRISMPYEDDEKYNWNDLFSMFINAPGSETTTALIVGMWGGWEDMTDTSPDNVVEALVAARNKLPKLKSLFIGDIIVEECEVSWLIQTDLTPILKAYPNLEYFAIRGSNELSLEGMASDSLKSLILQSGGLDRDIVQEVLNGNLPNLEHLELWLGSQYYGEITNVGDFKDLIAGHLFPKLKYLGLRNSEITDDLARELANSPILERLEILDLSYGTLGDKGAEALLNSPLIKNLKELDLHWHYCSKAMMEKFEKLGLEKGINIDLEEEQGEEEERYIVMSE